MQKKVLIAVLLMCLAGATRLHAQVDSAQLQKVQQKVENDKKDVAKLDSKIDRKQRKIERKQRRLERKQRRLDRKERRRARKLKHINKGEEKIDRLQSDTTHQ